MFNSNTTRIPEISEIEIFFYFMHKMSISNLIPATSLKIVGRGHVYHGVASPLLLKTFEDVWHRGYEFLEL